MEENKKDLIENTKVILIYGEEKIDGIKREGEIERIYKDTEDTAHFYYMKEYLQSHFLDEKDIQNSISTHDVNSIFYEIQKNGHIVFAENTSVKKHKTGILYYPRNITDKQKKSLEKVRQELEDEDYTVLVFRGLYRSEKGVLKGKQDIAEAKDLKDLTAIEPEFEY